MGKRPPETPVGVSEVQDYLCEFIMSDEWEVESSSNDRIVLRRKVAGAGGLCTLAILYFIIQFIAENWVFIVTILGIITICTVICYIIYNNAVNYGLKILITIFISIGLIVCVIYFGPKIRDGEINLKISYPKNDLSISGLSISYEGHIIENSNKYPIKLNLVFENDSISNKSTITYINQQINRELASISLSAYLINNTLLRIFRHIVD